MAKKVAQNPNDPMRPSASLLCKLGSLVVHAQEMTSKDGHEVDLIAFNDLCKDAEVVTWLETMMGMAMVPRKRNMPAMGVERTK